MSRKRKTVKDGFTFFKSYWEAVEDLPIETQKTFTLSVIYYVFKGIYPDFISEDKTANAIFKAVLPILKQSISRSIAGSLGGKQNGSKTEAKEEQTGKQNATYKDKERKGIYKKDTNVSKESGRNSPEVPKQGKFVAPTLEEFKAYYDKELSEKYEFDIENVYQGYAVADWHDSQGKPIKNWKQKLRQVWCNERNLRKEEEKKIDPQMQKMIDIANAHAARGGTF